jgi:hypothetical protein
MKGYIYKYTFPNGKVYIGQTMTTVENRHQQHITEYSGKGNPRLWEAFQQFKDYKLETIQTVEVNNQNMLKLELNQIEAMYINLYNSCNPDYGYNVRPYAIFVPDYNSILQEKIGELRDIRYKELSEKMRIIQKKIFEGKGSLTDEEKNWVKLTCCNQDNLFSFPADFDLDDLSKNKVENDEYTEEIFEIWDHSNREEALKWASQYVENHADIIILEARRKKMIVAIVKDDPENKIAMKFSNTREIAQYFNVNRPVNVRNVLEGRQKSAYGYRWMYLMDYEKKYKNFDYKSDNE